MDIKNCYEKYWQESKEWAKGRFPYLRMVLWFFFLYIFLRHLACKDYVSIFSGINLGIHEIGHIVTIFLPTFISVASGTIFQIAAPLASIFIFLKQRDYYAISVSFGWLSTSLFEISRYSGDAKSQLLPLVSPFGGGDIIHDFNYLLSKLHLLFFTPIISAIFWLCAFISMLISLIYGGAIILVMFQNREKI